MNVAITETTEPALLRAAVQRALAGVPHCYPVSEDELAQALEGPQSCKAADRLGNDRIWLAGSPAEPLGMLHLATERPESGGQPRGAIRFFWFAPGCEAAGAELLARAEASLREQGVSRLIAWHYDHTYPFYHAEHAYLTQQHGHTHTLLQAQGYQEYGSEVVLDWPHYDPTPPPSILLPIKLTYEWERGRAARRGLVLLARTEKDEAGVCVCISLGEFSRAPEAQNWLYTRWLGVAEEWRRRGLGRYLMRQALHTLHGEGYRHAAICALGDNEPALALYTGLGYQVVDWTRAYEKTLA